MPNIIHMWPVPVGPWYSVIYKVGFNESSKERQLAYRVYNKLWTSLEKEICVTEMPFQTVWVHWQPWIGPYRTAHNSEVLVA